MKYIVLKCQISGCSKFLSQYYVPSDQMKAWDNTTKQWEWIQKVEQFICPGCGTKYIQHLCAGEEIGR